VLVGTALQADNDPSLAAVRAVMAALNRRLGVLL
jgi:DNA-binding phage protein